MHQGLLLAIHQRMSAWPDDELLRLWVENDRFQYSAETFEAVRSILAGRGITPPQDDPPAMAVRATSRRSLDMPADEADARTWVAWIRPLMWVGVALEVWNDPAAHARGLFTAGAGSRRLRGVNGGRTEGARPRVIAAVAVRWYTGRSNPEE